MRLKDYLKFEKLTVSWLSKTANVPYTTVSEIVNEKIDIQKVQFGTVLRLCKALDLSTEKLFELCVIPEQNWTIFLQDDEYFMSYKYGNTIKTKKLCKYSESNSKYINQIAECYYEGIICGKEKET